MSGQKEAILLYSYTDAKFSRDFLLAANGKLGGDFVCKSLVPSGICSRTPPLKSLESSSPSFTTSVNRQVIIHTKTIPMKYTLHTHDSSSFWRRAVALLTSLSVMKGEATCHKALMMRYLDELAWVSSLRAASWAPVDLRN
jgi:hypothetical protein